MLLKTWTIPWIVGCCCWTSWASAQANTCASAYERAQELRAQRHLREALDTLRSCIEPTCSEFVRTECSRWLGEVEGSIPSIVLAARSGDKDLQEVRVLCDGEPLVQGLDGRAVSVDPGPHTLTFEAESAPSFQMKLVFREGEKNRLVTANMSQAQRSTTPHQSVATSAPAANEPSRPVWPIYALGGLSAVGLGGFVALGLMGNSVIADRERTCSPGCTDAELRPARTKYLLADISLGVGVLSLGAAGYLWLTAPSAARAPRAATTGQIFDLKLSNQGGYATLHGQF
jgi:hypothetical protein